MPLSLTLDYALPELVEPGFWRFVPTRSVASQGNPSDSDSQKGIWRDAPTQTLMLRPRQLDSTWLDTKLQFDSIFRLDHMMVHASDLAAQTIFEQPAFGNADNPYIFHVPVGPSTAFPAAPAPGAAPVVTGITPSASATAGDGLFRVPNFVYEPSNSVVAAPSYTIHETPPVPDPDPAPIGDTTDGKFLAETKWRLERNAAVFYRWHHPESQLKFPCTYEFYIAQYRLRIKDVVVEVFRDNSAGGDRTSFTKVMTAPLFSRNSAEIPAHTGSFVDLSSPASPGGHDRSLLWLPYRRHQILLYSNYGKWAVLTVRPVPVRLADDSDWDITRDDTLLVWVQTPAPGRFQIQRVKYPDDPVKVQGPTVTIDYTPGVDPTLTLSEDSDHGSTITGARTQPPSYTLPVNDADDCPPATTGPDDQSRTYGVELTLNASANRRWTPFFYGFSLEAARTFGVRPTTPTTVTDDGSLTAYLREAEVSAGMRPGDGRMTATVVDHTPYTLEPYYYRSYYPVRLTSGADAVFTGWTEPNEVQPLKLTAAPRNLTFSALDRWKQMTDTFLQDQRDWTEFGHIDVVLFVMQQAGIDTTGAVTPPFTPGVKTGFNTPLSLGEMLINQESGDLVAPWQPQDDDTAATYALRIAEVFSGWDIGFYLDGTPFYLPQDWFTVPTATFAADAGGLAPRFREPVNFRTVEPEANVIQVFAGQASTGNLQKSALWVDWASIRNPAAVNYIGKWRAEVIPLPGVWTCKQLNYAARTIFQQTRRRHLTAEWEGDFVPGLRQGHVATLGTYGNYRIQSIQAHFVKDAYRPASYTGEFLEKGYGVP